MRYTVTVPDPVYPPQEDTELLLSVIREEQPEGAVLDMGTGTGIAALTAATTADHVVAADINREACRAARRNAADNDVENVTVVHSDLFTAVNQVFDVILFNAPYIPVDEDIAGSEAWAGGETGREVIEPFLREAPEYLKEEGEIFLVMSSRTGLAETQQLARENDFKTEIAAEEKQPWETLYVLRLRRR